MTAVASNPPVSKPIATAANLLKPGAAAVPAANKVAVAAAPAAPVTRTLASTVSIGAADKPSLGLYTASGTTVAAPAKADKEKEAAVPAGQAGLAFGAGGVVAGSGHVVVDIQASDSGYDNKIYYSTDNFKTKQYIGVDNHTGSVDLGVFAAGTKIQFGIDNGQGNFFKTGSAADNTDNFEHARMSASDGGVQIGFEDLQGGGDRDFNDAIITVRNVPAAVPAPAPAPAPVPASNLDPKTNRSGLGDGTNPGQGAGTVNSPNQGANNPGATTPPPAVLDAPKPATPAPQAAKPAPPPVAQPAKPAPLPVAQPAKPAPPPVAQPAKPASPPVAEPAKPTPVAVKPIPVSAKPAEVKAPAQSKDTAPAAPKPASPPVSATALKDNRSGLGDGTNPGQGAGTANSPNTGTLNPGGVKKA